MGVPVPSKMRKRVLVVPWSIEPMNHSLSFSSSCMEICASLLPLEVLSGLGESARLFMVPLESAYNENGPDCCVLARNGLEKIQGDEVENSRKSCESRSWTEHGRGYSCSKDSCECSVAFISESVSQS